MQGSTLIPYYGPGVFLGRLGSEDAAALELALKPEISVWSPTCDSISASISVDKSPNGKATPEAPLVIA